MNLRAAAVLLLALSFVLLLAAPVAAQSIVTLCDSDTQGGPGQNLAGALALGGRIIFDCPPQTNIRMTVGHTVPGGTDIDGGGTVTLDAHGQAMTMFHVPRGSFAAERIAIKHARPFIPGFGRIKSSIIHAAGDVALSDVAIETSEIPVYIGGNARISGSQFLGNQGTAVQISGEGLVEGTRFIGNGTGLSLRGTGTVRNALFAQNTAGALRVYYPQGEVAIRGSTFADNHGEGAVVLSQRSGPLGAGVVTIRRCTFTNNSNTGVFTGDIMGGAGAINIVDSTVTAAQSVQPFLLRLPPARFVLAYNSFSGNQGAIGGAIRANLANTGGMVIKGGIFLNNSTTGGGGAIVWSKGSLLVTHSLFKGNQAARHGAALYGFSPEPGASSVIANSLVAENAVAGPGAAIVVDHASIINVTVAGNVGFGVSVEADGEPLGESAIANTILSENSAGNCQGIASGAFTGGNLQFGSDDCPGVAFGDPAFDALYVPGRGSAALALGDVAICRSPPVSRTDIVYQSRGTGEHCAAGAFERPPLRRIPAPKEQ